MTVEKKGLLFSQELSKEIRAQFAYVDSDATYGKRLFFENSGGSLRLKKALEDWMAYQAFPDCPERIHQRALDLKDVQDKGTRDIMEIIFGAKSLSAVFIRGLSGT